MKKIKFLAMALAAITMFSCSKENVVENLGSNAPGESSAITIKLTGEGNVQSQPTSRAAGTAAASDEVAINNYIVFLFRTGGALDCSPHYQNDGVGVNITNATTAAKTAYVVANTGALETGPFKEVRTEEELKAAAGDLMSAANTSSQTKNNLWLSGMNDITYGIGDAANKGTVSVTLKFVAAKIELVVKDNRKNMNGPKITIADEEVVLLYAGGSGKFFGDNRDLQNTFYSGDISYTPASTTTLSTALSDEITPSFTENTGNDVFNHFYAFGNNSITSPTILAIKSTKTVGSAAAVTTYYPVQFTGTDAIKPGNSYNVTITLNGDVNAGGGGGTTEPEKPVINAEVAVTITVATWVANAISKDFN